MKQKQWLPFELATFFRKRLQALTRDAVPLPTQLEFGKVYRLCNAEDLDQLNFVIIAAPTPYLDYFKPYEEHRGHARGSFHGRILATGEELALENYQGEWGLPLYPDDPARTAKEQAELRLHNQWVSNVLRQKGLA